jgi:hypothetical protein
LRLDDPALRTRNNGASPPRLLLAALALRVYQKPGNERRAALFGPPFLLHEAYVSGGHKRGACFDPNSYPVVCAGYLPAKLCVPFVCPSLSGSRA